MIIFKAKLSDLFLQLSDVLSALGISKVVRRMNLIAVRVDVCTKDARNPLVIPCGVDRSIHAAYIVVLEVLDVEISLSYLDILILVFEVISVLVVLALLDILSLSLSFEAWLQKQLSCLSMLTRFVLKSRLCWMENLGLRPNTCYTSVAWS
jgi:hypothetical protein